MELGVNLLNQILAGPFNIVGKALHIISSATPCSLQVHQSLKGLQVIEGVLGTVVAFHLRHSIFWW